MRTAIAVVFERVLKNRQLRQAAKGVRPGRTARLGGVWGSSGPLIAAALGRLTGRCVLLVAGHIDESDDAADDVEVFTGQPAQLFPAWEVDVGTDHLNEEITGERLRVLSLLSQPADQRDEPADLIVAPVMALLQPAPSPEAFAAGQLELQVGDEHDVDALAAWLVDGAFERVEQVDRQGEFARRGGIVDIFSLGTTQPVRVEFFGDRVESIRRFDLDTQRSTDSLNRYVVAGSGALPAGGARRSPAGLLDYLPDGAIVCLTEPAAVAELAQQLYARTRDGAGAVAAGMYAPDELFLHIRRFALVELTAFAPADGGNGDWLGPKGRACPGPPPSTPDDEAAREGDRSKGDWLGPKGRACPGPPSSTPDDEAAREGDRHGLEDSAEPVPGPAVPVPGFRLGIRSLERLAIGTHEALLELGELAAVADVWVYCENPAERDRFLELLKTGHARLAERVQTAIGHVHSGFHWPAERLVVVGHHQVFRRYTKRRRVRRLRAGRPIESLLDLREGDYVVHVAHGIGKFEGLKLIEREGRSEEYLAVRFAGEAVLNVPASRIDLVQKYVGSRQFRPSLSHLGGTGWLRQKQRVGEAVKDLAAEMLRIQALRRTMPGLSFPRESDWQRQFAGEFIYAETEDQINVMRQVDEDMLAPRPMDRLMCGDVGYGKTELAMRAAFRVVEGGRQVAVLVPTTVLAAQHLRTFRERFADYPFEIEAISRFRTASEQARIVHRLTRGKIDILIGTHRLLSPDIQFPNLGLVIIDEEQRFGVEHKEQLKSMRATVDVLTLTATPIPRTLHMALLGLRDISSLTTPPLDRRAIRTEVCHCDERLIRQAILRELNRQGQVFFVHNRVHNIEAVADRVRRLAPEARVEVAHGQMKEGLLEKTMVRFVAQEFDVLVCTTIIESGLDIPTANTIILHEADQFGLAGLHQLRGRVGRYKHRAYCYLLLPERRPVTPNAARRLKAIEDFSDLGAGFQIAMRDLEIRGAGNILGREQSGHIAAVGYELYCQLLERAVRELRGEKVAPRPDVHVELGIDAFIPRSYVPSERQRMEIYRRMATCTDPAEIHRLREDLADAYGPAPEEVQVLLDLAEVRVLAAGLAVRSIVLSPPDIVFTIDDLKAVRNVFEGAAGTVRLPDDHTAHWRPPPAWLEMPSLVRILLKRLRDARPAV